MGDYFRILSSFLPFAECNSNILVADVNTSQSTVVSMGFVHLQVGQRLAATGFQQARGVGEWLTPKWDRPAANPSQPRSKVLLLSHPSVSDLKTTPGGSLQGPKKKTVPVPPGVLDSSKGAWV